MLPFEFRIVLAETSCIVDDETNERFVDMANALYEAGCDDSSPGICNGVVHIDFHREARSLREAVASAIADIAKAGFRIEKVESSNQVVFDAINESLAS